MTITDTFIMTIHFVRGAQSHETKFMFVGTDPVTSLTDRLIQTFYDEMVISLTSVVRQPLHPYAVVFKEPIGRIAACGGL